MQIRGQFSDFFYETMLPAINANIFEGFREKPPVAKKLFQMETSARSIEQYTQVSGLGLLGEVAEGGEPRVDTVQQGFDSLFRHRKYGLAVEASKELVEDDKFGLIRRRATELGKSTRETREVQAATVFNGAFTASAPYLGPDGVALCSASHPLYKSGGLQSNILSTPADLDVDSLELALTDWENMKRSNGHPISLPTPRLLVAPANRWRAHEILKGHMRSDTANNTINAFAHAEGGPVDEIIVWQKLTDADAWFLVAPPDSTGLVWIDRVKPYVKEYFDDRTETGGSAVRYRASWGFYDYIGVYGTAGGA